MLVNPLPGTERTVLDSALDYLLNKLHNVVGGGGGTVSIERAFAYIEWVHEARRRLYSLIRPAELEQLLGLRSYETILAATVPFGSPGGERVLNGLVSTELDEGGGSCAHVQRMPGRTARPTARVGIPPRGGWRR